MEHRLLNLEMNSPECSTRPLTDITGHLRQFFLAVNGSARRPLKIRMREELMKESSWDYMKWYSKMSAREKQNLVDFLLRLDQSRRIDPEASQTEKVRQDITHIIESLSDEIQQLEPRLKGCLVPMGSSHNGTKIGDTDEFDFAYEMEIDSILSGRATFQGIEKGELRTLFCLNTDTSIDDMVFFHFPEDPDLIHTLGDYVSYYRTATLTQGDDCVMNIEHVAFGFYLNLYKALSMLQLPPGWSHGGFNAPNYSGVRFSLPSFLLQFEYSAEDSDTPLQISVDLAPVLKFPAFESYFPDLLNAFLKSGGYMTSSWKRLQGGLFKSAFYSQAEEKFLAGYSWRSIPKTLLRLCKALHALSMLSAPKYFPRFLCDELKEFYDKDTQDPTFVEVMNLSLIQTVEMVKVIDNRNHFQIDNDLPTYSDIGESGVGEHQYISSYTFKRTVMTLMALDEQKGRSWTAYDLPDLIMSVYTIINDVKIAVKAPSVPPETLLEGQVVCVPLGSSESESQASHDSDGPSTESNRSPSKDEGAAGSCTPPNQEDDLGVSPGDRPKFYNLLKSAIISDKCEWLTMLFLRPNIVIGPIEPGMDMAISRVFRILHAASEGKETVDVAVWREIYLDESGVSKEELKNIRKGT